jgi:hypothetical protein
VEDIHVIIDRIKLHCNVETALQVTDFWGALVSPRRIQWHNGIRRFSKILHEGLKLLNQIRSAAESDWGVRGCGCRGKTGVGCHSTESEDD